MPTNLPPEYYDVEKLYREARTPEEKAEHLEEMLSTIPKHKGTDKLRADLRRKLSKLKAAAQTRKKTGRRESAYHIDREGAGQAIVVGPPNVGKSSLVAALTNATPEVADYPYTTQLPIPGMMPVDNIRVQLIDTPPVSREFVEPQVFNLIRQADLILLVVDLQTYPIEQLEETAAALEERRIIPGHLRERYAGDQRRLTFIPLLVLVNKNDDAGSDEDFEALCELIGGDWPLVPVSAATGRNLDRLKQLVFEHLGIVRVYSKPPGKEPDFSAPFVMRRGGNVEEFAGKVHKDFVENLKSARVWGSGVHDGQMVGRDHVLHDGDVVELRI
jgi:ribosome-interacting GTPase 1